MSKTPTLATARQPGVLGIVVVYLENDVVENLEMHEKHVKLRKLAKLVIKLVKLVSKLVPQGHVVLVTIG